MKWIRSILVTAALVLAPFAAIAAWNIVQNDTGTTAWLNELTGNQILRFSRDDRVEIVLKDHAEAEQAYLDERHIVIDIADLSTASSNHVVIPVSGRIVNSWATGDNVTTANSTLRMYLSGIGGRLGFGEAGANAVHTAQQSLDARVTNFEITFTAGDSGRAIQDEAIGQDVGMGDIMAIENTAGTGGGRAKVTIVIRMQ